MITTILYMCVCGSGKPYVMGTKCSSKMAISEILFLVGDFLSMKKKHNFCKGRFRSRVSVGG